MPGTILENLSCRKLSVLVAILLVCQITCFLVGLIAPTPATSQGILSTVCIDPNPESRDSKWFTRSCPRQVVLSERQTTMGLTPSNLVFVVEMPLYGLDFSRWQQNLVGVLQIDMVYQHDRQLQDTLIDLTLDARLAYSDKAENGKTPWEYYAHSEVKRHMECVFDKAVPTEDKDDYPYNCAMVPLFELGSLYHDYYLLNLRLPYNKTLGQNVALGKVHDIFLHTIHMNGGYTKVMVGLKTCFLPIIVGIMIWFWHRVHILNRSPALLEYMLISLGGTLVFLNLPLEFLTLYFEMRYMLILNDIRQGVFYSMLLSFWLVFAGEHMLIQDQGEKNSLRLYWKHLSTIIIGCFFLLIFDLCERGVQLVNPFYSVWVSHTGSNLALTFIIIAGISACCYLIYLFYMIWQVFRNISIRRANLPSMSQARRLHYEGIIYRFNFLMLATVICAVGTIISFILTQVSEGQNKWDDNMDIELSSALHTGVYGMWNVYICAMLMLYAPSHKKWPNDPICTEGEDVEFSSLPTEPSANEISSLTAFATKASIE